MKEEPKKKPPLKKKKKKKIEKRRQSPLGEIAQSLVYGKDYPSGWLFWKNQPREEN